MRLTIATPTAILLDDSVQAVTAEDSTGSFGILPGHADFVTVLTPSVLRVRLCDGRISLVAVDSGVLTVDRRADAIAVATRDGVVGTDLETLEHDAVARYRARHAREAAHRFEFDRLRLRALRQIAETLGASHD